MGLVESLNVLLRRYQPIINTVGIVLAIAVSVFIGFYGGKISSDKFYENKIVLQNTTIHDLYGQINSRNVMIQKIVGNLSECITAVDLQNSTIQNIRNELNNCQINNGVIVSGFNVTATGSGPGVCIGDCAQNN